MFSVKVRQKAIVALGIHKIKANILEQILSGRMDLTATLQKKQAELRAANASPAMLPNHEALATEVELLLSLYIEIGMSS